MKSGWKTYLLYASLIIFVGGGFLYLLVETIQAKNTGFEAKTLWDWMELLIIPLVLATGAFFLNRSERAVEREIAKDRQHETALQTYIDKMGELLLDEGLRTTEEAKIRNVARTRTVSIMQVLDKKRNELVIQFLREVKLITDDNSILNGADMEEMDLQGLDLRQVHLQDANLRNANLRRANLQNANLRKADLQNAVLQDADLWKADLQDADLQGANLKWANLRHVNLRNADLQDADLRKADLFEADLQESKMQAAKLRNTQLIKANLLNANLYGADLRGADLREVIATSQQLMDAKYLKNAIMPRGRRHN